MTRTASRAWIVCRVALKGRTVRREHFGGASTDYTPSPLWGPIWYTDYARINAHGTAARRAVAAHLNAIARMRGDA